MSMWRHRLKGRCVGVAALGVLMAASAIEAAPGSWVGEAPAVRLFTPERWVESRHLAPPAMAAGATIRRLRWRFTLPPGQPRPAAWLCHPQRCMPLPAAQGHSEALAGLSADRPLTFRFRLPASPRPSQPLRIEGLQAIVDFH